jgi:cephalosporin hydroxylase
MAAEGFYYRPSTSSLILDNGEEILFTDPLAFKMLSEAWIRLGWDAKYVYGFSWLGRPIIQLPEDLIRIQEVIFQVKPDVIIETGVAHGGSLIFYASLCAALGKGRVIGVDIEIRPHNRAAIMEHRLSQSITLIEGSSVSSDVVNEVKGLVGTNEVAVVVLDSNHSKSHVLQELQLYSQFVSPGSFIVACDGIMKDLVGAPRSSSDWNWNNPVSAVEDFLKLYQDFECVEPVRPFNEGLVKDRVSYWPSAYIRRKETFH